MAMVHGVPPLCPQCGAETVPHQRFCPSCGLNMQKPLPEALPVAPPAAPVASPVKSEQQSPLRSQASQNGVANLTEERIQRESLSTFPTTHLPAERPGRRKLIIGIVLVLLLLAGGAGIATWQWYSSTTQPKISSRTINALVNYAGVDITVVRVEQAQRFLNDPNSSQTGMLRVHLQLHNKTTTAMTLDYARIARLLLPGGKTSSPAYVYTVRSLPVAATQTNFVDFAVPLEVPGQRCTLQLGGANEAQILLPLTGRADVRAYESKKTVLTEKRMYQGLEWMLSGATTQLGSEGEQAKKGMQYITFNLTVTNTLAQTVIPGSPFDYLRLKVDSTTFVPLRTTLPVSFKAHSAEKSGSVTFLIPQNTKNLTFIMQAQHGFEQATVDIQLAP